MKIESIKNNIARAVCLSGTHDSAYAEVDPRFFQPGDELPEREWVFSGEPQEHERLEALFDGKEAL